MGSVIAPERAFASDADGALPDHVSFSQLDLMVR